MSVCAVGEGLASPAVPQPRCVPRRRGWRPRQPADVRQCLFPVVGAIPCGRLRRTVRPLRHPPGGGSADATPKTPCTGEVERADVSSALVGATFGRPPICADARSAGHCPASCFPLRGKSPVRTLGNRGPLPSRRLRETRRATSPCGGGKIGAFCRYNVPAARKVSKNADPSSLFWRALRFLSRTARGISEILRRAALYFAISRNSAAFPASAARTEVLAPVQGRGLPSTRVTCPPASDTMRAPAA